LTLRSAAAVESLPSSSFAIDPALRAHHNRKLFENVYLAGCCYFKAQAVSNKLTRGTGEKQGSNLMRSSTHSRTKGPRGALSAVSDEPLSL
jgi:hypothetical protein